jgi:head-tail adaptor
MSAFTPSTPYTTAIEILIPTYTKEKGEEIKTFPANGIQIFCSFKTYGGTETNQNGIYSVINTANVETWYRPDITAACRIKLLETNEIFEIIGRPENIDMRHQFLKFKVRAVEGGA